MPDPVKWLLIAAGIVMLFLALQFVYLGRGRVHRASVIRIFFSNNLQRTN